MQEKIKELLNRAKEEIKKLRDRKGLNELRVRFWENRERSRLF